MVKGFIEWEHTEEDGLVLRCKPSFIDLADGETRQHAMAARKEILLTMRSLIDVAIKRTDEKETKPGQHGVKIKVE
jgi:hypothetical protein